MADLCSLLFKQQSLFHAITTLTKQTNLLFLIELNSKRTLFLMLIKRSEIKRASFYVLLIKVVLVCLQCFTCFGKDRPCPLSSRPAQATLAPKKSFYEKETIVKYE
jgi:hypothetical protein